MWREGHTRRACATRGARRWSAARALLVAVLAAAWLAAPQAAAADDPVPAPPPSAPSAIIIDRVTGRVLYGKGIHDERPMASTTKIMTALLAIQKSPNLGRWLTAPAAVDYSSGIGLEPGERITVRQALLGLMLKSAQDCGLTLAYGVTGSETAFVGLMNARAHKLGLHDTHYMNCTGSHRDPYHHSSVADLARLGRYAMRNATFRDIVGRQHALIRWDGDKALEVTCNNLLLHWDWADGIKCGYTGAASFCLVGSGQPGLRPFITATLASPSRDQDARDHVALFEWASTLYEEKTVVTEGDIIGRRTAYRRGRGADRRADVAHRGGAQRGSRAAHVRAAGELLAATGRRQGGGHGGLPGRRGQARDGEAGGGAGSAAGDACAGGRDDGGSGRGPADGVSRSGVLTDEKGRDPEDRGPPLFAHAVTLRRGAATP